MVRYRADTRCKVVWTHDLHKKFVQAVEKLGVDNAVPKKIVDMMKVTGLTRDHVASHLQKYRMLAKKISDAYYQAQTFSNSSLTLNHEQNNWPSYNGVHEINPLILDTSSSYFPVLESSNFNTTISSDRLAHSGSLPNEGYSMPVMTNNLDEQGNLYDNANNMDVMSLENSGNSGFMQNLDGFISYYGDFSTDVPPYNNIEMGSSGDVHSNKELVMSWNNKKPSVGNSSNSAFVESSIGFESNYYAQNEFVEMGSSSSVHLNNELAMSSTNEKPISIGNSSNSSFVESSVDFESNYFAQNEFVEMGSSSRVHLNNELATSSIYEKPISIGNSSKSSFLESSVGFRSNYFGQNEFVEMGSFYGSNSNGNLENGIGEDDLMLDEDAKTFLLSYADGRGEYSSTSNNLSVTAQPQNQDVNEQNFLDIVSFDSSLLTEQHSNEETITKSNQQTLDAYIPAIDPTFDMPIWSPEIVGDHMTYEDLFSGPFLGDQRINQD